MEYLSHCVRTCSRYAVELDLCNSGCRRSGADTDTAVYVSRDAGAAKTPALFTLALARDFAVK